MGVMKFLLGALVLVFIWNHAKAITPVEYEPSGGGGKCDTDADCNNKGICINEEGKQASIEDDKPEEVYGKCICDTGRDGANCEKVDVKKTKKGRRTKIFNRFTKDDSSFKRQIQHDAGLKAVGLKPEQVADAGQAFVLFNPRTKRYVRILTSSPTFGVDKNNKYVGTEENPKGDSKLFVLEKDGSSFNIKAMDNDGTAKVGYLYLSSTTKGTFKKSHRIMMSADKKDSVEYKFTFIEHEEQNGVYKIKVNGKTVYGSIGGFNVKADDRADREKSEEIWFQINLRNNKELKVTVEETKEDVVSRDDDLEIKHEEFANNQNSETKYTMNKENTITNVVTKFDKYAGTGTAGVKAGPVNLGFSLSKEKSTTNADTITSIGKQQVEITVKPKKKICVEYTIRVNTKFNEEKLKVKFNGKEFEGYKLIPKAGTGDITFSVVEKELADACT